MKFIFLRILLPLLLFLIVRAIVKALFAGGGDSSPARTPEGPQTMPAGGDLKKDPVCGTYVSAIASLQQRVGRETVYFCSEECRSKYQRSA